MGSLPPESGPKPAIMSCDQHQLGLPYQNLADEALVQGIETEVQTISPNSQEIITSTWASFSNLSNKERQIMINGILARCSLSQLSSISTSVNALLGIDFLAALPTELSYRILQYLDATTLCRVAQVSHIWKQLADDDLIWRRMCEQHINRRCSTCGWSIPLLRWQRRLVQPQNPGLSQSTSDSSSISLPPTQKQRTLHHQDPPYSHQQTRPWREVFKERFMIELNWKHGRYRTTELHGHGDSIMCLQIHDNYVATGSYDTTIKLWNLDSGELIRTFKGHTGDIRALRFDSHKLISASSDETIKVWNWQTGNCVLTLSTHDRIYGLDVAGNILASNFSTCGIKVWNFENKETFTLLGHSDEVTSVNLNRASRTLVSGSDDCTIWLWDLDTRQCIRAFQGHLCEVQHVAFLSPQVEHSIELRAANGTTEATCDHNVEGDRASYGSGFLADPERPLPPLYVISASIDGTLRIWNTASGARVRASFGNTTGVWALAVDELRAVSSAGESKAQVWDVITGNRMITLENHTAPVTCVALTDYVVATGSDDCRAIVYNFKPET